MTQKQDRKLKNTSEDAFRRLTEKLKSLNTSVSGGLLAQGRIGQGSLQQSSINNPASNAGKYELKHTTQITEDQYMFDGSVLPITVKRTDSYSIERIPF